LRRSDPIPDDVRRFLLTSIPSVPHLELLMLAFREQRDLNVEEIARRLYISPEAAQGLADDLARAELVDSTTNHIRTEPPELVALLASLDHTYARHVRAVSELLHGNLERKAHNFAKAFDWRTS
jgi:hypothetical protein